MSDTLLIANSSNRPARGTTIGSPLPVADAVAALRSELKLDFGAVDVVMDDKKRCFIVDVNPTPFWGSENQPEIVQHLTKAFD